MPWSECNIGLTFFGSFLTAKMPPPPKTEEDRLRLRILELEAEVAFLKKLDEIIKRDEAKRQKPSKV